MRTQTEIEQELEAKKKLSADLRARLEVMHKEWESIDTSDYVGAKLAIQGRLILAEAMAEIEYVDAHISVLQWALETPAYAEGTAKCKCGKTISANKLACAACVEVAAEPSKPPEGLLLAKEARGLGILQEVNREFFHPIGLALAFQAEKGEDLDTLYQMVLIDARNSPEGYLFDQVEPDKHAAYLAFALPKHQERLNRLGFVIQPLRANAEYVGACTQHKPIEVYRQCMVVL